MLNLVRERDSKIKIQEAEFSIIHANYSLPFPDLVLQNLPKRQPVNIEVVSRLSLVSNNANNIVHKSSEIKDLESILNLLPKTTPFQFISSQLEAKINNKQLKSNEYKPTDSSQLIGSGSRDAAKIVKEWLNGFEFENKSYSKPPTSISNTMKKYWTIPDKKEFDNFIDDDEISISSDDDFQRLKRRKKKTKKEDIVLKAMMLIGPSGVGKSTIIELVSRECGFEIIEWNSSVRNSKSLEGLIEAGKSSRINGKLPKGSIASFFTRSAFPLISTIPKNTIIDQTLIPEESTKIAFKSKSKKSKKRASNEIDLESDDEPVKTKKSKKTKLDLQKKTSKPDGQKKMSDFFKKPAVKDIATLKEEGGDISKDSDSKMLYPTPINVIVIESSPIKAPLKISQEIEIPGLFDEIIDTSLELPTHSPKKTSFDIQKDPTENEVIVIQSSPIRPTDVSSSKSNPIESITISESPIKLNTDVNESKKTILVIEEADIIFAQDKGFWSCVSNLLSTSKTPVIITSTETPFDSQNYSMSSSLLSFFNEMVHVVNVEPDRAEVSLFLTALACLNDIVVDNYDDIDLRHGKLNLLSPIKYSAIDYNDLFQDCENLSVFDLLCDYGLYDCAEVGQEEDQVSTFPILELSKYLTERTSNVTCREEIHDRLRSVKDDNPESRFV